MVVHNVVPSLTLTLPNITYQTRNVFIPVAKSFDAMYQVHDFTLVSLSIIVNQSTWAYRTLRVGP